MEFLVYVDAAFGALDGHNRQGVVIKIRVDGHGDGWTILRKSSKQAFVTMSTAETELTAQTWAARMSIGLKNVLVEAYGFNDQYDVRIKLHNDNTAAVLVARGEVSLRTLRRIRVAHLWILQAVQSGLLEVEYLAGEKLCADVLTKVVPEEVRARHNADLNLYE